MNFGLSHAELNLKLHAGALKATQRFHIHCAQSRMSRLFSWDGVTVNAASESVNVPGRWMIHSFRNTRRFVRHSMTGRRPTPIIMQITTFTGESLCLFRQVAFLSHVFL